MLQGSLFKDLAIHKTNQLTLAATSAQLNIYIMHSQTLGRPSFKKYSKGRVGRKAVFYEITAGGGETLFANKFT